MAAKTLMAPGRPALAQSAVAQLLGSSSACHRALDNMGPAAVAIGSILLVATALRYARV